MNNKEWFASWFDTSFYHKLYRERNAEEAQQFIENLLISIDLPKNSKVLDLACGKGRHSLTLNKLGMNVLGVDLSEKSIEHAKKFENDTLHFQVQDMRCSIENQKFDAIFNLFTSFGYFENEQENQNVLNCISSMLQPEGLFVFDYLNLQPTLSKLVPSESKHIEGTDFEIERHFDGKFIRKKITVFHENQEFHFEEKVRGYSHTELVEMMQNARLQVQNKYGDFSLQPYKNETSDRLILICKKDNTL